MYDQKSRPISETSFMRGIHGGLSPDSLPGGYLSQGANIQVRGGFVSTRPRYEVIGSTPMDGASFQGAGVYSLESGDELIYGLGDQVRSFNPDTATDSLLYTFPSTTGPHYHAQADRYFIVQNNIDRPCLMERGSFTREAAADGATPRELPTGSIMAYAHGRVFIVPRYLYDNSGNITTQEGRPYWMAGDIMLPLDPENVLKVTEDEYWNEGGATSLPFEGGFITGLMPLQNAQSSASGVGALLAFGRTGVSAYAVAASRSDWKDLDFSQTLFTGTGTTSPKSLLPVNDDLLFRAPDGIRSLRVSSQQAQGGSGWSIRPMSYEVSHRLDLDAITDLPFTTSSFADNRVLIPSAGRIGDTFRGLISLDTLVAATLTQGSTPAYDDLWVSAPVHSTHSIRINGKPEHIVVLERSGSLVFCKLTEEKQMDFGTRPVTSRGYTRAYSTKSQGRISLSYVDVIFRNIDGPLSAKVYYRTDQYHRWTPCPGLMELDNQTRRQVRFSARVDGCREDGTPPFVGNSIQLCVEWTGVAEVELIGLQVNQENADGSMLQACSTHASEMSPSLDALMVTLDDPNDLLEIT